MDFTIGFCNEEARKLQRALSVYFNDDANLPILCEKFLLEFLRYHTLPNHGEIINLPIDDDKLNKAIQQAKNAVVSVYKIGHRDAIHDIAEIALEESAHYSEARKEWC